MGDGDRGGDPKGYEQNPNSLLGKMLRLDVESETQPYAIPPDNPFHGAPDCRDVGLRNPWRLTIDRKTGD